MIEMALLANVAKFIRGVTFKPDQIVKFGAPDSFVCMRTKNVQKDLDESDLISIPKSCVKNDKKILQEGDLLVSTANSFELVGKSCWVDDLDYPATAGGFISILRADEKQLLSEFLCDWLNSESVKERILRNISGTAITRLTIRKIKDIKIELPPIELQKKYCKVRFKIIESKLKFGSSISDNKNLFSSLTQQAFNGQLSKQTKAA